MRRACLVFMAISLSTWLRADIPFLWLDGPTGRNNPSDPKNPNFSAPSNLPLAPATSATHTATLGPSPTLTRTPSPTPSATDTITAGPSPTPSPTFSVSDTFTITDTQTETPPATNTFTLTATITPTPTITATIPVGNLKVSLYDASGAAVAGRWVQVGNDSAGALQTDLSGEANFSGVAFPTALHVFDAAVNLPRTITILGVTGPSFDFFDIGGTSPASVTMTAFITHSFGSGGGAYSSMFSPDGTQTSGGSNSSFGNPAQFDLDGQAGNTAYLLYYNYQSGFQEACFVPPTLLAGANTVVSATATTSMNIGTMPVTLTETLIGGLNYYFRAYAGDGPGGFYILPVMGTYSAPGPATFGPILYPPTANFYSYELGKNLTTTTADYSQYIHLTSTTAPASLHFDMQPPLQWTRSPTAGDPHLTVLDTDSVKADIYMANVGSDWMVVSLNPALNEGIDVQYPTQPAAVTLTPFTSGGTIYAGADAFSCVSPMPQAFGKTFPYVLRANYVQVAY